MLIDLQFDFSVSQYFLWGWKNHSLFKVFREGTFFKTTIEVFLYIVDHEIIKTFYQLCSISLSCVALLVSTRFICCDISSAVIGWKENLLFLSTVDTFFDDRDTRMIFIFLYSFFQFGQKGCQCYINIFHQLQCQGLEQFQLKKCAKNVAYLVSIFY